MFHQINKPCMACHKRPAKIKFVKIADGKYDEVMICQFCAQSVASEEKVGAHLKLDNIMKLLLSQDASAPAPGSLLPAASQGLAPAKKSAGDPMCPSCGLSYSNYRPTLMLGCSECYAAFGERLRQDLRRIHGSDRHVGRVPPNLGGPRQLPAALRLEIAMDAAGRVESDPDAPAPVMDPAERLRAIRALKKELQEAVDAEDFQEAARLRDQIKEIESRSAGEPTA